MEDKYIKMGFDLMNKTENKPTIWKAVTFTIPCALIFLFSRTLLAFLIGMLGVIISKIPILGKLLGFIFALRGDNLSIFAIITSVFVAYFLTTFVQNKIMKDAPTNILSRRILGVIIALIHMFSLIVNISEGNRFFINIICMIASLVFMFGKNKDL